MVMKKYALKECSKCHLRSPAPEMFKLKKRVKTGSSIGVYNILGKSGIKGSVRSTYRTRTVWLCKDCKNRDQNFGSVFGFLGWILKTVISLPLRFLYLIYILPFKILFKFSKFIIHKFIKHAREGLGYNGEKTKK